MPGTFKSKVIDPVNEEILSPGLDEQNLPTLGDPPVGKRETIKLRPRYFDLDISQTSDPKLIGTGQPFLDEENLLAGEQAFAEKAFRGLVSRGLSVAPKIGQSIGHIGGAINYGMDYLIDSDQADPNVIWDNAFVNYMSGLDEKLRESLPIYKSYSGRHGNLLQQMGDPGFWFDDMFDSLAFLASAYATGLGAGAMVGAGSRALALTKAMTARATRAGQVYGATVLNGIAESGFEAHDFAKTERDKLAYADYGQAYNSLTEQQQQEISGKTAEGTANVFRGNLGVLIIPNYVQSRFMFGKLGDSAKRIRRGVRSGQLTAGDVNVFKQAAKQSTLGIFTEGPWEEGMQHALQSYSGRKESFGQSFDDYMIGAANQWVDNWSTTEGQKNMMLGAIVGGVFGGFGAVRESGVERKLIAQEEETFERLKQQLTVDDRWYIEHITQPFRKFKHTITDEDNEGNQVTREYESFYNNKGETEIDYEKAQKMFLYGLNNKFLFDEAMVASIDGNNMHLDRVNSDALARLYYKYATNQDMTLDEAEEMLLEREMQVPMELQEQGISKNFTKADLAPLREAFEEAENSLISPDDFTESESEAGFKQLVRKTLYGESVKRSQYEQYLTNPEITSEQKEDVRRLIEDSQKITNELKKKSTRSKLLEDFKKERLSVSEHLDNMDRANKEGLSEAERLLAQYELDEFKYINGEYIPFSTHFDYGPGIEGAALAQPLGAKYNYFYDRGQTHYRKAELDSLIEQAKRDPSKVNDVVGMMARDIQNGVQYTKEDVQKVEDLINDKERLRVRWDREARKRQDDIDNNFGPVELNPAFDPVKLARDEAWMENHQRRIADLERAKKDFNESILGVDLPTDRKEMRDQARAQRSFQREFVDKKIERGQDLLDKQKSNPDAYDDYRGLQNVLDELNKAKKVYGMPGRNRMQKTTREFRGMMEELDRVISEIAAIEDEVRDRQHNRDLQDLRTQQNYSAALFSALGIDPETGEISNQALVETIKSIITEEVFNGIIAEASTGENAFDSVFVEKIIQRVKDSKEGPKRLIKFLEDQNKQKLTEFAGAYQNLPINQQEGMAGAVSIAIETYKLNPVKLFSRLLEIATDRLQSPASEVTEIDKFMRTKDVYALKRAIEEGAIVGYKSLSKEDLLAMLDAHLSITSTIELIDRLNSDSKFNEMIATESKVVEDMEHAPSNQQRIALREAVVAHQTKLTKADRLYAGWVYLKGLAGTGKTRLMAVYLPELLGIKSENVLAVSTHPNALNVLKNSLSDVKNVILDTEITQEQLNDPNIQMLIIDEVARLDKNTLNEIAKNVALANRERENPLRVYVMGDPSQVIGEGSEFAAINDPDIINIKEITPLTAVFRSGNTALLHVANSFLDFPGKIADLVGTSSEELGAPADGVHVSTSQDELINQYNVNQKANQRTRALVVSNKKLYNQYKKIGENVFMHYEVAGLEYDEIYVDINPKDFENNSKFNQAMYTATSRAKEYLFLRSYEPVGKWRSQKGTVTKVDTSERANKVRGEYTERLIMERQVMGEDMKGVTITSPQRIRSTEKDKEDIAEPQTEQDEAAGEPQSTDNVGDIKDWEETKETDPDSAHDLWYPTNQPLSPTEEVEIDGKIIRKGKVQVGSKVLYLRSKDQGGQPYVTIVAQNLNPVSGKWVAGETWSVIGIMSEDELENTPKGKYLKQKLLAEEGGQDQFNRLTKGDEGKLLIDDPNHGSILAEGVVSRARPLSYRYTSALTSGRGMLQNMIDKAKGIFGDPNHKLEFSVRIFTNKEIEKGEYEGNVAGVPYLIIKRKVMKDGKLVTAHKPQFIRLSSRRLNISDDIAQPIHNLRRVVKLINQIGGLKFGTSRTNELIKRFQRNFEVSDNKIIPTASKRYNYQTYSDERSDRGFPVLTEEQFNQLEEVSQEIISLYYGVGEKKKEVESEEEFKRELGTLLDRPDMSYRYVPHGGKRIGGYIEQEDQKRNREFVMEDGLVEGKGEAQISLDILAKSNKGSPWVVRRAVPVKRTGKTHMVYVSKAKGILAEDTTYGAYYQHLLEYFRQLSEIADKKVTYRDFLKNRNAKLNTEESISEVEKAIAAMEKDGLVVEGHSYEDLQRIKAEHVRSPISEETLDEILSFDANGFHTELFYPLKRKDINDLGTVDPATGKMVPKNIKALDILLATKLEEILRTRIQVRWAETSKPKRKEKHTSSKRNIDRIIKERKNRNRRTMLKGEELGEPITREAAHALARRLIPGISKNELEFMDELTLRQLAGEDAYGLYEDEAMYVLEKDGITFVNPIRHESFHKIYNEHLTPLERDIINFAYITQYPEHRNKSKIQIEELLASTFTNHQRKPIKGLNKALMDFFNWLARRLRFVNLNTTSLSRFFETIESGYFIEKKYSGLGVTRRMRDVKRKFGVRGENMQAALATYRDARELIEHHIYLFNKYGSEYKKSEDRYGNIVYDYGTPMTKDEAVEKTLDIIRREYYQEDTGIKAEYENSLRPGNDMSADERIIIANSRREYIKAITYYDDILKDIYENYTRRKKFIPSEVEVKDKELELDEVVELKKEDAERVNHKIHILPTDEVNYERKLSRIVKDYLSNIGYENSVMNWREVYIRTLNMMEGIQSWSDNFIDQLSGQVQSLGNHARDRAIADSIYEIHEQATSAISMQGRALNNKIRFLDENTFIYADEDVSKINGVESLGNVKGGDYISRKRGQTTKDFIADAAVLGYDPQDVVDQFRQYQSLMTLRGIINVFNNQKQKNIFLVDSKTEYGKPLISYMPGSYMGIHRSLSTTINDRLRNKLPDLQSLKRWKTLWLTPNTKNVTSLNDKHEFVKKFVKQIGLGSFATDIPRTGISSLYNDILGFFERAETGPNRMGRDIITEDQERVSDMSDVLSTERKMVNRLAKQISFSSKYMRATNVRDVKGKRKYTWSPTSNAYEILFNFVRNTLYTTGDLAMEAPRHLRGKFYTDHNIFLNARSRIFDVIDNDGIKYSNNEGFSRAVTLNNESTKENITRIFVAGFIDRIRRSSPTEHTYFQFLYPNERTSAVGAEIKLLSYSEIRQALTSMMEQIYSRPDNAPLKDYNRGKFINFGLLEKTLKGKILAKNKINDKTVDRIMELMAEEARILTDAIVSNNVVLDKDTSQIKSLAKVASEYNGFFKTEFDLEKLGEEWTAEDIYPLVMAYFANDYINSYYLNQLILGDYAQYKNEEDIMRRFSLATTPGHKPIVNERFGMRRKARFLYLTDPIVDEKGIEERVSKLLKTPEEEAKLPILMEGFENNFASSDGQGFMTPERYNDLKNAGYNSGFALGNVIKPVVFTLDENGFVRAVKYSVIVLSDELVEEFPSLGILRDNMRNNKDENGNPIDEAIFGTGVKVGTPVLAEGLENHERIITGEYVTDETEIYEVENDNYRVIYDPRAEIEGSVRQPSQLLALAGVLENNVKDAASIYNHFTEIIKLGGSNFLERFRTPGRVRKNILSLLRGHGSEREHDMISDGLSINFPTVTNKVALALAAELQNNIVDVRWQGTKLVLQSGFGVAKYNSEVGEGAQNLEYFRDPSGRLVAEVIVPRGLLPKEYEDQIEAAIASEEHSDNYFNLPDLLGFRIPTSDVHSAIAMKVVGFYSTPDTSVIIAPDLLVALHGSDFDVDTLFIMKRELNERGEPHGYVKKNKKWVFNRQMQSFPDNESKIAYHKNGILDRLLDIVSSSENMEAMLAPIPLNKIREMKDYVVKLRKISPKMDLSNTNDKLKAHTHIFGAARATGIYGNALKTISYILRTGEGNAMPKILGDDPKIVVNGKNYNRITLHDDSGLNRFINDSVKIINKLGLSGITIVNSGDTIHLESKNYESINEQVKDYIHHIKNIDGEIIQVAFYNSVGKKEFLFYDDYLGERITVSIDGFINAAIDNIRELALPTLNITDSTINGFIALRAMGMDLKTIINILQQPILLDYSRGGSIDLHKERIAGKLGPNDIDLSDVEISDATLMAGIKAGTGLNDMQDAVVDDKINRKAEEKLKVQLLVLNTFEQANVLGNQIGSLSNFVKIGRTIPVQKVEIDKVISLGEEIFGPVNENGTLEDPSSSTFPFDISNFFKKNPHLLEIYQNIRTLRDIMENSLKKYHPKFQDHVDEIYDAIATFNISEPDAKELIREQLLNYLISREVYSGEYKVDQDVVHVYKHNDIRHELTGPKAVNQIFIRKVMALKEHIMAMQDAENNPVQNKFLDHLSEVFNPNTSTRELQFEGRSNMDPMDILDVQQAFLELNQYDVEYNKKTKKYKVIQHKNPRSDNEYSNLQKEFVTYGIMNWGLGFGAANYSIFLPSDLFKGVDRMFNRLLDSMIGKQAKENFAKIKEDFMLQFASNKGQNIRLKFDVPADVIGKGTNRQGEPVNVYSGEENGYKFDRRYSQQEGKEFPRFVKTGYGNDRYVYVRLNDPADEHVYYAIVDKVSPFQVYHTTDEVLEEGYSINDAYHEQVGGKPIRNFRVPDINQKNVEYRGNDVQEGDIVSLTAFHDITRINKKYMRVKVKAGNVYSLSATKYKGKPFETVDVTKDYDPETMQAIAAIDRGHRHYAGVGKISTLLDNMIERSTSQRRKDLLIAFRDRIVDQQFVLSFRRLPGRYQGSYLYDGSIAIDLVNVYREQGQIDMDYIDRIIFHELVHGITLIPYYENEELRNTVDGIIAEYFVIGEDGRLKPKNQRINNILTEMLPDKKNHRGFKDTGEFMAEIMANDEFAEAIDALKEPKKKSLLRRIWDTILEWMGVKRDGFITSDLIRAFKNVKHKGQGQARHMHDGTIEVTTPEGVILKAEPVPYESEVIEEEVEEEQKDVDPIRAKQDNEINKILNDSKKISVDKDENGEELDTYSVQGSNKKIRRISDVRGGMISFFSRRKIDQHETFAERKANRRWGGRDPEHKLQTDIGMETKKEYQERMEHSSRLGMIKGSIIHLFLKRHFNKLYNLGFNDLDIQEEINDMASLSEGDIVVDHYRWVEDPKNLDKIFRSMGLNYYYETDKMLKDVRVLSEISIYSELLGFAGTPDVLIAHADGRYSLRDVKTGLRFGERLSTDPLKYGMQDIFITDNQRERAKLQIMWYAFLLKLENPGMQFRDLQVSWLPNELLLEIEDNQRFVEVGAYLRMIETFLKDKKALGEAGLDPDVHSKILKKSPRIFDVGEYTNKSSDVLWQELKDETVTPEEAYRRRIEEMTIILGRVRAERQIRVEELDNEDKRRLAKLYNEVQIMKSDPSLQLDAFPGKDIGKLTEWLGNYSDVDMGEFQTWKKIRDENWDKYTQQHNKELKHMMKLVDPIYNTYMKGKLRLRFGGQDRIANVNYAELFGFAFKEVNIGGYQRERLVLPGDDEWKSLTKEQKELLTHLNDMFKKWFIGANAYLNQTGGEIYGNKATWLEIFNAGKGEDTKMEYYEGWFPKVMKTSEELNYEEGARVLGQQVGQGDIRGANFIGRFTANSVKTKIRNSMSRYLDTTFEMYDDVKMALPIKYLDNMSVLTERNYTKNLVFMFDRWNKSMLHKSEMDRVYIAGQGLKQYLGMKKHANGQPMFQNTIGFLEKKLISDIQNRTKQVKWTRTPVPAGWYYDPILERKVKANVDIDKVIGAMMNWTSATIMWLRPMQGGGNGLHAKMLTWRESMKGTIASSFLHIDGDAIDFKVEDNIFADNIYFTSFLPDVMLGRMQQNKLWLLAEKLNYIPDNYDYATNRRFLLSTRNQITDKSSMYLFHSKPEEYVSLTTLAAQLHYLKHPTNGKSLWDNYAVEKDPKTGVYEAVWKGGIRGYEKTGKGETAVTDPITELTSHEIAKLKKVHERMQGGYRKEEASNLEVYVMGKAMIQFKKYLPRLIMNALGSKKEVVDLGYYKTVVENGMKDQDGNPVDVYEWHRRLNEGRWRTLINVMLRLVKLSSEEYKWSALSSEQKQNIVDAILTLGIWSILGGAYLALFYDDDDDDTFKKWWKNYLVLNLSQQYNPLDLLHTLESASRPVSLARMYKATESFWMMLIATGDLMFKDGENAFTNDGDLKGWNNFKRSIPYLASFEDFASKMRHGGPTEEWWTDRFERKWR